MKVLIGYESFSERMGVVYENECDLITAIKILMFGSVSDADGHNDEIDEYFDQIQENGSVDIYCGHLFSVDLIQKLHEWSAEAPKEQGIYWHWDGENAPLPMFVMWSGTSKKCFVSGGQLGLGRAIDCDQYGGQWLRITEPKLPKDAP